jgi:NAD(P)-dependent dehydrogenase (short-subunit alcohol dehydrogenase family)
MAASAIAMNREVAIGARKRVCLLTGASGVLGTAFCKLYAERYDIVAVYRRNLPSLASQELRFVDPLAPRESLPENLHPVFAIRADLSDDREIARVVELALARFDQIDLLVNAAVHSVWAPLFDSRRVADSATLQFQLNVLVPLRLTLEIVQACWRDRADENRRFNRNVVNVSSLAGVNVYRNTGQSVYAASKAALNHLTRHMASELDSIGVRANALAPNTFPRIVPTERVVESIVRLDKGHENGQVLSLDNEPERRSAVTMSGEPRRQTVQAPPPSDDAAKG